MVALREMARHPLEQAAKPAVRQAVKRPFWAGGIFIMIVTAIGVYWLFPEIRRYLRIERM
ncbi:MAG TPA: hypothetical protein VG722_08410 [Tepidisphaeraceae bacterium]|nr:hypothetical protein [Tepidisphaeraceae bacterium]